jgi:hypothetical protein
MPPPSDADLANEGKKPSAKASLAEDDSVDGRVKRTIALTNVNMAACHGAPGLAALGGVGIQSRPMQ